MAPNADPYRTLGLERGAPIDEVKRAYRRLAKANHPDAAGPAALTRFLAIQAAYEQLVEPAAGSPRARPAAPRPRSSSADPERAEATRRAYTNRTQRPAGGPRRTGRPAGEAPPRDPGPPPGDRPADPDSTRTTRSRGKATLGSTSYDDAEPGAFEPDWGGASWYGTTSGTYWTINPKEYADPRKHGPEYQARARRASASRTPGAEPAESIGETTRPPAHTTSSWWESTTGPTAGQGAAAGTAPEPAPERHPPRTAAGNPRTASDAPGADPAITDPPIADPATAAVELGRALTNARSGGLRGRAVRAVVGWLPIALALGWLVGELTGCGRFAATCDPSVTPLAIVGQGILLAALVLLPEVAALAAGAALVLLVAAVAASVVLSATGDAADEGSRRVALGALLVVAWLTGLGIAIVRRIRTGSRRAGPVS